MPARLGQNFLRDKDVLEKIIRSSALKKTDLVIEVGPGEGVLTELIAEKTKKIIAVELDERLAESLKKRLEKFSNVEVVPGDILKINLPELISDRPYKVVANIPYYITSPIIRLFLEQDNQPTEMILMIQKEVAGRIIAQPGQMSILAVAIQYYADAEVLFEVPREAFSPVPEVDSAVIRLVPRKKFEKENDKLFFRIVRSGFSAKRKTLMNNLSSSLQLDKETVEEKLKAADIAPSARAQELSLEDWKRLSGLF